MVKWKSIQHYSKHWIYEMMRFASIKDDEIGMARVQDIMARLVLYFPLMPTVFTTWRE